MSDSLARGAAWSTGTYSTSRRWARFAAGFAIELLAGCLPRLHWLGYGNVLIGAMVGAWLSAAANRRDATLEMLPEFLASTSEPAIRMSFVALLAWTAAAFVQQGVFAITIGGLSFEDFRTVPKLAFVLGVIAGIGERALSVRLINRANEFVAK